MGRAWPRPSSQMQGTAALKGAPGCTQQHYYSETHPLASRPKARHLTLRTRLSVTSQQNHPTKKSQPPVCNQTHSLFSSPLRLRDRVTRPGFLQRTMSHRPKFLAASLWLDQPDRTQPRRPTAVPHGWRSPSPSTTRRVAFAFSVQ